MSAGSLRRRELVAGAAIAAAGVVLGLPGPASAQSSLDVAAVINAVRLEQALAVAYSAMSTRARLGRQLRDLLAQLAEHERQHTAALLRLAEFLGALPPPVPTLAAVETRLPGVRAAVDRGSALIVIDQLERAEVRGFYFEQQILTDAKLIEVVGAVMCSDSQHLAVVRQIAGRDPIPTAFETGDVR